MTPHEAYIYGILPWVNGFAGFLLTLWVLIGAPIVWMCIGSMIDDFIETLHIVTITIFILGLIFLIGCVILIPDQETYAYMHHLNPNLIMMEI